ncbi:MAG: hypothetical protein SCK28_14200 [Bacillota bacterium]|nr:hypothetical protein [Bacillota bacterium]
MEDVVGLKLEVAEKILADSGIKWDTELTTAPLHNEASQLITQYRVVRQKKLSVNTTLLTIVKELEKEVDINGH